MNTDSLPLVSVISLGGTIASIPSKHRGALPTLNAKELVEAIPNIDKIAHIEVTAFKQVPSSELTIEDIVQLVQEVDKKVNQGAVGVVITQGTDTLEETSFVSDLIRTLGSPLVFTGAMRNPTLMGADGSANLLAAIQVAMSPACWELGTLVVLNDDIHAARFVHKTHTSNPATFVSFPGGPLGFLTEGRVRIFSQSIPQAPLPIGQGPIPKVGLLKIGIGGDDDLLALISELNYQGLVVESFGGGHVPMAMVEALTNLAISMPVVLSSRTGRGEILRSTYGFPGSEEDLLDRGLISSGWLDGLKSRILLSILLWGGAKQDEICNYFDNFGSR